MRLELPVLIVAGLVALLIWRARSSSSSSPIAPAPSSSAPPSSGDSPFGRDADGMPQVMA